MLSDERMLAMLREAGAEPRGDARFFGQPIGQCSREVLLAIVDYLSQQNRKTPVRLATDRESLGAIANRHPVYSPVI